MSPRKPLLASVLAVLLPAAFVVVGVASQAAADSASDRGIPTRTLSEGSSPAPSVAAGIVRITPLANDSWMTPKNEPVSIPIAANDSSGHASAGEDGLPHTGADGLGTVMFAFVAITALAILCLIVGFKVSRRETDD